MRDIFSPEGGSPQRGSAPLLIFNNLLKHRQLSALSRKLK